MERDRLTRALAAYRDLAGLHAEAFAWLPSYLDLVAQFHGIESELPASNAVRDLLEIASEQLDDRRFRDFVLEQSAEIGPERTTQLLDFARLELRRLGLAFDLVDLKAEAGAP